MNVIQLLANNNYIIINRELIHTLGLYEAIILGELCSEYSYWEKENKLDTEGYFYSTRENIERNTGINSYHQRKVFSHLIEEKIILAKKVGIPCKIYYSINEEQLLQSLEAAENLNFHSNVIQLLANNNYIIVNRELIHTLGLYEAIILGELCSEYSYWEKENKLDTEGYFYSTRENIEKNTGINLYYQRKAFSHLIEEKIILAKKVGIPCKIYYSISEEQLLQSLKTAENSDLHSVHNKEYTECNTMVAPGEQLGLCPLNTNNNKIKKNKGEDINLINNISKDYFNKYNLNNLSKDSLNKLINNSSKGMGDYYYYNGATPEKDVPPSAEKIFNYYEKNFGNINTVIKNHLKQMLEKYSPELVIYAMDKTLLNATPPNFSYLTKTLKNLEKADITTIEEAQKQDKEFHAQTNENTKTKKQNTKIVDFSEIINSNFQEKKVKEAMYDFIKMRKNIKKPLDEISLKILIKKLYKLSSNIEEQIEIIENSTAACYPTFFPLQREIKQTKGSFDDFKILAEKYEKEEQLKKQKGEENYD